MTNPRDEKIKISETIVALLEKHKEQIRPALVSSLKLETGFTERVIQGIINDLLATGKIRQIDDRLCAAEKEG